MESLRIGPVVEDTDAEGPGRRFAVWVQGCTLRCPGCCNPELFDADGPSVDVDTLLGRIAQTDGIEGISVLGGEPFQQPRGLLALVRGTRALGLTTMVYSGYTLAELHDLGDPTPAILEHLDLLVDGRYDASQPEPSRTWIGSANQKMHHLSAAYSPDDPRFTAANTVEIRFDGREVRVNGWPLRDLPRKRR